MRAMMIEDVEINK